MQLLSWAFHTVSRHLFRMIVTACPLFAISLHAQTTLRCTPSATNLVNRSEGLAEPGGDIYLNCSGGLPGTPLNTNLIFSFSVPVTNRLNASGAPDVAITLDTGNGPAALNIVPVLLSSNTLAFNGLSFTLGPSGAATIRITNLRLAVNLVGAGRPVNASISTSSLALSSSLLVVATPNTGLLATYSSTGITCIGSTLPPTFTFANFLAYGTNFASTRVTEGFANSFAPKDPSSDAGTRIRLTYSNFPTGARVFIPDYVAGNDALAPTAAGDLGGTPSAGAYSPTTAGTLLLARVIGADATGAGGTAIAAASSLAANTAFSTVSEVPLVNGIGTATYEVIDANPNVLEYAQFPTFIGVPPGQNQNPVVATEGLSFGPVNAISTASIGVPVPRFTAPPPPNDCQVVGDCGAAYFPVLSATTTGLQFSVSNAGNKLIQSIAVNNTGGGFLEFSTSVSYTGAGGWLTVTNLSVSTNHTTLQLVANPALLAQGVYQAMVTVNAGAAGTATFPATFTVGPGPITVSSVVNAASFQPGPLVAGSLATIQGVNFNGKVITVTFNGISGTVLFSNAQQINVQVPASLASNTSAQVQVTVDGNSSPLVTVPVANINPGIFGVLNQDNTINSPGNPARSGTVIQIFATGLISPVSSGAIVTGLANQGIPTLYSGGFPNGLQQVNAQLPANAASLPGVLVVCGTGTNSQLVCSPAFNLYTK